MQNVFLSLGHNSVSIYEGTEKYTESKKFTVIKKEIQGVFFRMVCPNAFYFI